MNWLACKTIIRIVPLFISTCLFGQGNTTGSWDVINTKVHFDNNNGFVFIEAVVRSQKLTKNYNYHDLKTGFVYNPSDKLGLHFGAGTFANYSAEGNFKGHVTREIRTWEQFQLSGKINIVRLEHRYRFEQRFFSSAYANRFRYRINTITPVLKRKTRSSELHIMIYDEIFLTDRYPIFDKNRWFAGVTYNLNKYVGMQMGWIHDFGLRTNGTNTTKNYLQTSLLFDMYAPHHVRKHHSESIN